MAANYLDIKPLLDLTCATVASMIKGKTPEEIRKTFNIVNDFTPEEEAQVREENKWCEEGNPDFLFSSLPFILFYRFFKILSNYFYSLSDMII